MPYKEPMVMMIAIIPKAMRVESNSSFFMVFVVLVKSPHGLSDIESSSVNLILLF